MDYAVALGSKTFAMVDQQSMACWSGDHNPMHVDPVAARRLLTGRPVVHGVHLVLEALARWADHADAAPCTSLQAEFNRAVSVGDQVDFVAHSKEGATVVTGQVRGVTHMSLMLGTEPSGPPADPLPLGEQLAWTSSPSAAPAADWIGRTVCLPSSSGSLPAAERAARLVGADGASLLGQASTMVGMGCPGLHSVFSSLKLVRRSSATTARCRVDRIDTRFGLVRMTLEGAWRGEVRAFVRAAPRDQASMNEVMAVVPRQSLGAHHTWVLGGSRGLGELAAKIASAAGSRVTLTYARGIDDAERVAREIEAGGCTPAAISRYEIGQTDVAALCRSHGMPDLVLYFATPRIAQLRTSAFNTELLTTFNAVYCAELARIALALDAMCEPQDGGRRLRLFQPSTTYIDELPNGMVEYAMSKAAAEVLSTDLNKRLRGVQIMSARLPRLPTDQTNGLMAEANRSALDTLAPLLADLMTSA